MTTSVGSPSFVILRSPEGVARRTQPARLHSPSNSAVDRYRSAKLGMITTTVLPA